MFQFLHFYSSSVVNYHTYLSVFLLLINVETGNLPVLLLGVLVGNQYYGLCYNCYHHSNIYIRFFRPLCQALVPIDMGVLTGMSWKGAKLAPMVWSHM